MELVGDFRSTDPIFKGCYGDLLLYSDVDLGQLQCHNIHLPPYQGEIPTPPAPSYLQAKQSEAAKWSPPWATMLTATAESPKTKCSSRKGRHHHILGHGSNTSTPKCPDSTSAKKPSGSKEQVPKEQDKSPKSHGSHKYGRSPNLPVESDRCKQKKAPQKTPANSTPPSPLAPVGLMASAVQWGPTVRQLNFNPLPSPRHLWGLAPCNNSDPYWKKVGAC